MIAFTVLGDLLDTTIIYKSIFTWSTLVMPISGVLLILGCYIRVIETQMSEGGGLGQWGLTLRSIAIWSSVLVLYISVAGSIIWFMNDIVEYMKQYGSVSTLMHEFDQLQKAKVAKSLSEDNNLSPTSIEFWSTFASTVAAFIPALITSGAYSISLVILIGLAGFLKLAHAILFGVLYVMGLFVIPLSVSNSLNIRGSWLMGVYFIFMWPIVDAVMLGLFTLSTRKAIIKAMEQTSDVSIVDTLNITFVFAVINIIAILLLLASVAATLYLVSKTDSNSGYTQPIINMSNKVTKIFKRK